MVWLLFIMVLSSSLFFLRITNDWGLGLVCLHYPSSIHLPSSSIHVTVIPICGLQESSFSSRYVDNSNFNLHSIVSITSLFNSILGLHVHHSSPYSLFTIPHELLKYLNAFQNNNFINQTNLISFVTQCEPLFSGEAASSLILILILIKARSIPHSHQCKEHRSHNFPRVPLELGCHLQLHDLHYPCNWHRDTQTIHL